MTDRRKKEKTEKLGNEIVSGRNGQVSWEDVKTIWQGGKKFDPQEWNDFGNGARIRDYYRDQMQWIGEEKDKGYWMVYNRKTGIWERSLPRAKGLARTALQEMVNRERVNRELEDWQKWCGRQQFTRCRGAALEAAIDREGMTSGRDSFDSLQSAGLWICGNGVLNLESFLEGNANCHELLESDPSYRSTLRTEVEFHPEAQDDQLDAFLQFVVTDRRGREQEGMLDYLLRAAGSWMLSGNPDRKFTVMYAPGGSSGKSTFVDLLGVVFGGYAAAGKPSMFKASQNASDHETETVRTASKRLLLFGEANASVKLHGDKIKELTGGDTVSARDLYKGGADTAISWVPVMHTNTPATIENADASVRGRLVGVEFKNIIDPKDQDPRVKRYLLDTPRVHEAFLVKILRGLWQYGKEELWVPEVVQKDTRKLFGMSNREARFLEECCKEGDEKFLSRSSELYEKYWEWCSANDEKDILSKHQFAAKLDGMGYESRKIRIGPRSENRLAWHRIGIRMAN